VATQGIVERHLPTYDRHSSKARFPSLSKSGHISEIILSWRVCFWPELFLELGNDERDQSLRDLLVALGSGVDAVVLHHAGLVVDVLEQEGQQGDAIFAGEQGVGVVDLADIVWAVVGRQGYAGEKDLDARLGEGGDDCVEILSGGGDGQAAQAVVAAEFHDDQGGVEGQHVFEAVDAVFRGITTDSLIDDTVVIAALFKSLLQIVGIGAAGVDAVSGGEAVSKADDDGAVIARGADLYAWNAEDGGERT
jgi:hypothetical protein